MRDRTAWLLGMILSLVAVSGACAGEPYSFDATPGTLPKTVVPIHYALDLKPDLDKLTLGGSEAIEIEVRVPTDRIVLNAVRMTFASAAVDGVGNAKVSFDADEGNATLTFARQIEPGRYTLRIAFSGRINERVGGASRVEYRIGQSSKRLLMTHLQPDEARQVFPSFDEPTFKATFELAVTVPRNFLAVSNMPVSNEDQVAGGLKRVSFQRTPAMPTYVFALVAGELERTSQEVDGITVGVVHAPGRQAATRFALESGATLVRYYSDYTGVKYVLPKLDLIAIPGRAGAAHENWGAITFNQTSLLIDPPATSFNARRHVFMLVAHEMAHQWFGNLVTMAWWDNLWLNEAFATWMESKTVELFHPEWPSWLYAADDKQAAMAIDAGSGTRPMHRIVSTRREMNAMFDPITYNKGAAVVRMLENYLGADVFRDGVRRYMAKRAYSNATPADLWRALEEASGKGVEAFSGAFVEQAGVPLVVANGSCVDGRQQIKVRQERFTIRDPKAQPRHWQVPIVFGPAAGGAQRNLLDGGGDLAAGTCNEIVKLNLGNAGYYRVEYDAGTHAMLAKAIGTMLSADRINLLADTWALFEAGRKAPEAYADLVDNLPADDDHWVWELVVRAIKRVDDLSRDRPGRAAFRDYVRSLLRPVMDRVGWEPVAGEAHGRAELRALVIRTLGDFGDADTLAEARRRFVAFESAPGSLVTDLRQPVLHLAGRGADRVTYDRLVALGRNTSDNEERRGYYAAAAAAVDPGLLRSTLALALESGLSSSTIESVINEVAAEHRDLAWQFIRDNFSVLSKQGTSFANNLLVKVVSEFADPARAEEVANFAPLNETERGRRAAERAKAQIMANAELAARLSGLDSWIAARLARR